ncbi:polysaccharide pyruvyl transferase family protein [Sphingomonas arantia]|uniref:Polysaccharide pyruvyl transferase family protein n=1 Tax=Sphingomonas arantia TaxID=1460676 RepID=A0ABW4TUY4_9SPHN
MSIFNKVRRLGLIGSRQPLQFPGFLAHRIGAERASRRAKAGAGYFSHYAGWHGNAGDVMIVHAQHALFASRFGETPWVNEDHKKLVRVEDVERINRDARAVVVGGGGLLLPDRHRPFPNVDSDWLWNIPLATLKRLRRPLLGFAIGYNRMEVQDDFFPSFRKHITETVERSAFFSVRNRGSLEKLSDYLPPTVADKIVIQPCPTNVMSLIRPDSWSAKRDPNVKAVVFVLFMGFKKLGIVEDRDQIRRIARQAKRMAANGWEIHIATHTVDELAALPAFVEERVMFSHRMMDMMSPADIVRYYRSKTLVIGMRGHGVMLPYGIGVPVMGIINHVKVRYFLEEVGLDELAVPLRDPNMEDRINELVTAFEQNRQAMYDRIDIGKQHLWRTTHTNMEALRPYCAN